MTEDQKHNLLRKDLCARLPYGVRASTKIGSNIIVSFIGNDIITGEDGDSYDISFIKPYLRPMSLMTEEEFGFLQEHLPYDFTRIYSGKFNLIDDIHLGDSISIDDMAFLLDYLNKRHFDYRGLIEKGLAIEAPEGMYKF